MAWGGPRQSAFATFLILCSTSFFLGILFSLFPYDYPLLWSPTPPSPPAYERMEAHLKTLHASPLLIPRILHTVVGTGLLGFFMKLYRPTESNALFDGASLVLYMIGFIIYMANIVKGLRVVSSGEYDVEVVQGEHTLGGGGGGGGGGGSMGSQPGEEVPLGRDDSLKVLAASNTILALVLVGVLVLQAGQWYAERKENQEMEAMEKGRDSKAAKGDGQRHRTPAGKKKA